MTNEAMMFEIDLQELRRHLKCEIRNYDANVKKLDREHYEKLMALKTQLFQQAALLDKVEKEIYLEGIVALCNTPDLFAPVV